MKGERIEIKILSNRRVKRKYHVHSEYVNRKGKIGIIDSKTFEDAELFDVRDYAVQQGELLQGQYKGVGVYILDGSLPDMIMPLGIGAYKRFVQAAIEAVANSRGG